MTTPNSTVEAFREEFRATVPAGYSGVRHGIAILAIGIIAIAVCVAFMQSPLRWWDYAMIPPVVLGWNLVEWYVHLKVLHRPGKGKVARILYNRHTLTHHRFYTHEYATLRDTRDLSIVFFPVFALPAIIAIACIPALGAGFLISRNAGLMIVLSTVTMYLLFELFHLCAHLPENTWVGKIPVVNSMSRHHRAHHDHALMMTTNMNFTLPVADWYFKTGDLERGLLGMTFNGFSTRHVRRKETAAQAAALEGVAQDAADLGKRA
jgi:hypothetical protein